MPPQHLYNPDDHLEAIEDFRKAIDFLQTAAVQTPFDYDVVTEWLNALLTCWEHAKSFQIEDANALQ